MSAVMLADQHTTALPPVAFDVSVLIVSFNTREVLRQCLQSVFDNTNELKAEIIVVDNASSDGRPR